ncbi:hypothetical protein JKP88DRAFT_256215, partial [Tribonema minus]
MTGAPVLPFLVRGYYDKYLVAFADECVAGGPAILDTSLHEFNRWWLKFTLKCVWLRHMQCLSIAPDGMRPSPPPPLRAGDWYPWGLLYRQRPNGVGANTVALLRQALQRVISIFRTRGAPVLFQMNLNDHNGFDDPRPMAELWPGDEGLDAVAITSYNRAFSTPNHQYTRSFRDGLTPMYQQ